MSQVVGLPSNSHKPITTTAWVRVRPCKLQKECTRLAAAWDKDYQLLAHRRWFSPCTPASSTTKTGRHDIAEILLKVALSTKNQSINQSIRLQATVGILVKDKRNLHDRIILLRREVSAIETCLTPTLFLPTTCILCQGCHFFPISTTFLSDFRQCTGFVFFILLL